MIVDDSLIITEIERLHDPFQRFVEHFAKYTQYADEGRVQEWRAEHQAFLRLRMPLVAALHQHPIFGHTKDRYFGTKQLTFFSITKFRTFCGSPPNKVPKPLSHGSTGLPRLAPQTLDSSQKFTAFERTSSTLCETA
jgi:hypothetical protein